MRPNELTVGGRHEVEAELRNMHKKILHAKSTINTRLDREYMAKLPSAAAARKSRPRSATQRAEDVQEAKREAARSQRLAARSGKQSFSAPPVSLHLASKLSENRRRRQHVTDRSAYEHERELYHLSRRIQSRCSITERKKNRCVRCLIEYTSVHVTSARMSESSSLFSPLLRWMDGWMDGWMNVTTTCMSVAADKHSERLTDSPLRMVCVRTPSHVHVTHLLPHVFSILLSHAAASTLISIRCTFAGEHFQHPSHSHLCPLCLVGPHKRRTKPL